MSIKVISDCNINDCNLSKDNVLNLKIQKCIKNVIKSEGYVSCSVDIKLLATDGHLTSTLYELDLKGQTDVCYRETKIFMKLIAQNDQMRMLSMKDMFKTELFVYKSLGEVMRQVQDEVGLTEAERFNFVRSFDESNSEMIILENMAKKGFKTFRRLHVVTLEFADLAIKELAKFHALSFVLEARRYDYFIEKVKTIRQPLIFNKDFELFMKNMFQKAINYLDGKKRQKLEDFARTASIKYEGYLKENSGDNCCLCHGDFRPHNVLMKETNGKISKVIPIDYQLIFYGCPVTDFLFFIITATDQKFRRSHLSKLKDVYYDTLGSFLKHFNLNVDSIYPRRQFEKIYKEKLDYGLILGMIFLGMIPLFKAKGDDVPDLTGELADDKELNTDDRCADRLIELVDDYIEWGYL